MHCSTPARRFLLLLALCGVALVALAGPAGAHATLESLSPESDAVLTTPPTEIVLTFSEPISIPQDAIRVFDPSGRRLPGITATAESNVMRAELPELTVDGSYTVAWHMVSADGHALSGAYLFHLVKATLTEPVDAATGGVAAWPSVVRAVGSIVAIASLVGLLGLAVSGAAGTVVSSSAASPTTAAVSGAGVGPPGRRRRRLGATTWLWAGALLGTVISLYGSAEAVGSTLVDGLDVSLSTSTGRVSAVACGLALLGLVVSLLRPPRAVQMALGLLVAATIALEGHAVALSPIALSASLTVVHVLAAVTWAAGLFWIERRTRSVGPARLRSDVESRSPWAIGAVLVLAVTGTVLVLDRVEIGQLTSSWYGRIALVKLLLLGVAVLFALRNRFALASELPRPGDPPGDLPEDSPGDPSEDATATADQPAAADTVADETAEFAEPVRRMRVSVRLEMLVLASALIAGAALAQIAPPVEGANGGSFVQRAPFGDGEVELTVEPGARGVNEVHVTALGDDGRLMPGLEALSLSLSLASDNIGPLTPQMQVITSGHSVSYARFPFAGEWSVLVTAKVGKFEALSASFTVPIGP